MSRRPGQERPPPAARSTHRERRRALSQNLLVDDAVARRLVARAAIGAGDLVVELGAGRGALTEHLVREAGQVIAIERDPQFVRILRERFPAGVEVRQADFLRSPLPVRSFTVVANLPFSAGTDAVRRLLHDGHGLRRAVLLLQREAARRLAAGGRFSATWAPWFSFSVEDTVPRTAFRPVPEVDAATLVVAPRATPLLSPAVHARHVSLVDGIFVRGRGRTLVERLGGVLGSKRRARALAAAAGITAEATPSQVEGAAWARLTALRDAASLA